MSGLEIIGGAVVAFIAVFAMQQWLTIKYVKKSTLQEVHRYLAEHAVEVTDDVVEIMGEDLPDDTEFRDRIRPLGVQDPDD
jgi:hypothetical protein